MTTQADPIKPPLQTPFGRKGFGRIPVTDLRDHLYPMTRAIARSAIGIGPPVTWKRSGTRHWDVTEPGLPVDQGPTPKCGEFSMRNLLGAAPIRNRVGDAPPEGEIYGMSQTHDNLDYGWAKPFDGTTTRSIMKVGVDLGYWAEYRWSFEHSPTTIEWVLNVAPFLAGTIWPDEMMSPTLWQKHSWLDFDLSKNPTMFGPHAAGHLWCVCGVSTSIRCIDGTRGAYEMIQSWGPNWGGPKPVGTAYIPFAKFDILMKEGGEIAMPLELKHAA